MLPSYFLAWTFRCVVNNTEQLLITINTTNSLRYSEVRLRVSKTSGHSQQVKIHKNCKYICDISYGRSD
jgi:hypothetical protein